MSIIYSLRLTAAISVTLTVLATAYAPSAAAYVSPVTGQPTVGRILSPAVIPEHNWQPGHRGVDLPAATGSPIRAADDGIVAFAGVVAGTPTLSIDHPDGLRTTYLPVFAEVRQGQHVLAGQRIGSLAPPVAGHVGLHWGVLDGRDSYLDPLRLLRAPTIRLKPLDDAG